MGSDFDKLFAEAWAQVWTRLFPIGLAIFFLYLAWSATAEPA